MFQLLIATTNLHKLAEYKAILKEFGLNIELFSLNDFPEYRVPEETGKTFSENAIIKAESAAKSLNMWTLADDSGLVVPVLDGRPGVYSARYAGKEATDKDRRQKLLAEMEGFSKDKRMAYYECALALSNDGKTFCVVGCCEGEIATSEKGGNGFGYDAIFIKHGYRKTFSEVEASIKNKVSHRRKALDKMMLKLENILTVSS